VRRDNSSWLIVGFFAHDVANNTINNETHKNLLNMIGSLRFDFAHRNSEL
jgi:hypothetical protein